MSSASQLQSATMRPYTILHSIIVRSGEVPEKYVEAAKAKRAELVESLAEVDDEIAEAWLEEREIAPEEFVVSLSPPCTST